MRLHLPLFWTICLINGVVFVLGAVVLVLSPASVSSDAVRSEILVVALGLSAGPLTLAAQAAGTASSVVAEGNLSLDGVLEVTQTVTYSGAAPAELRQRFETRENLLGDRQYVQEMSDVSAIADGAPVSPVVEADDRYTTVTVPTNGAAEVQLRYTVTGEPV